MWRVNISTLCRQCLPFSHSRVGIVYYSTQKGPGKNARNYEIKGIYSGVGTPSPQPSFLKALKDVSNENGKKGRDGRRGREEGRDRDRDRDRQDKRDKKSKWKGKDKRNVTDEKEAPKQKKEWGTPIIDKKQKKKEGEERGGERGGEGGAYTKKRIRQKKPEPFVIIKPTPKKVEADRGQFENTMFVTRRKTTKTKGEGESTKIEGERESTTQTEETRETEEKEEFTNTMFKKQQETTTNTKGKRKTFLERRKKVKKEIKVKAPGTLYPELDFGAEYEKKKRISKKKEREEELRKMVALPKEYDIPPPPRRPMGDRKPKERNIETDAKFRLYERERINYEDNLRLANRQLDLRDQKERLERELYESRIVKETEHAMRIDRWVNLHFPHLPHSRVCKLLRTRQISYKTGEEIETRVLGRKAKRDTLVGTGWQIVYPSRITLDISAKIKSDKEKKNPRLTDEEVEVIKSWVVHKDDDILIINKPEGLPVQGGTGITKHLAQMLPALKFDKEEEPRLVHRLDRDTSGALILARHRRAAVKLTEMFKHNKMTKIYWALVTGIPEQPIGKINMPLEKVAGPKGEERIVAREKVSKTAKPATTDFSVAEECSSALSFIILSPNTGRTHQLRVHCASGLKTPILGDRKYGDGRKEELEEILGETDKLHLHARRIIFTHPMSDQRINVAVSLPPHMLDTFTQLGLNPNYKEKLSGIATAPEEVSEKKTPTTYGNSKNVRSSIWNPKVSSSPRRELKMKAAVVQREKKEKRMKNRRSAGLPARVKTTDNKARPAGKKGKVTEDKESKGAKKKRSREAIMKDQKYRSSRRTRPVRRLAPKIK